MNIKIIEHFEIIDKLGQGGMGVVYKARDLKRNTMVALKILSDHNLNTDVMKRRFQREAAAGMRLEHPNIVKIFEVGEANNELFISMEYIEGQTLRELLSREPLSINKTIEFGISTARALECAHDMGIIHRDIKPENIMITCDGITKVMDFGLAKIQGASMLTMEGEVLGTISYMSPQQTQGETIDQRSDIFSLGVILYELLTGHLPFYGDYDMAIIYAIINEDPSPLREINDQIPIPLEQVIMKCLQKDLSSRYQKVSEFIDDLERVQAFLETDGLQPMIQEQTISIHGQDADYHGTTSSTVSGLRRFKTHLFGRESELQLLRDALQQAISEQGNAVLVAGEAGIGKTRLIQELEKYARTIKIKTLKGRCLYRQKSFPYFPFVEAINEYFNRLGVTDNEQLNTCVEQNWPDLIPILSIIHVFLNRVDRATIGNKEQLWEAVYQLLTRISEKSPMILFIDDLHWAEEDTIDLFEYLVNNIHNTHFLVIGSYRPEDIRDEKQRLKQIIEKHQQASNLSLLELERIDQQNIRKIIQSIFRSTNFPDDFCQKLYDESAGNPLFIVEMLKLMVSEQVVVKSDGGFILRENYDHVSMPAKIQDIILRRIDRLDEQEREILEIGAVEGESFHSDTINSCMEIDRLQLLKILQNLEREHHLIYPIDKMYHFDHAKIQEFLYGAITPELQIEYHLRIGNYLAGTYGTQEANSANIAHHFLIGEQYIQALPYLVSAANRAKNLFANQQALESYQKALQINQKAGAVEKEHYKESILEGLGDVLTITGRHDDAELNYKSLLEISDHVSPMRVERLWKLGALYINKGEYKQATETLREAEIEYQNNLNKINQGMPLENYSSGENAEHDLICSLGKIKVSRARIFKARGKYKTAQNEIEEGLQLLSDMHHLSGMGQANNDLGNILFDQGEYSRAEQIYLKSLEIRQAVADKKGMAETYNNLGITYIEQGAYDKAAKMMEKSIDIMRSIGFTIGIAGTSLNLGCIYQDQGKFEEAYLMHKQSYTLSEEMNNKPVAALSLSNLGLVCLEQRKIKLAVEHLQKSLDLMDNLDFRVNEPQTQVWLSQALLESGDEKRAAEISQIAYENAEKLQQKANLGIAKRWLATLQLRLMKDNILVENIKTSPVESLLNESKKIFTQLNMEHELGRSCLELIRYYQRINENDQIQENTKKAQLIFKKLGAMGDLRKLEQAIIK